MSQTSFQAGAGAPGQHPAGWYPDPFGRHESRYWDGQRWTEHVASHGRQAVDRPPAAATSPTVNRATERVVNDVQRAGVQGGVAQGGGTIFTEPILVVNQKAKLIEVNNEYAIFDQHGRQLGAVRQVGQSMAKKAIRVLTSYDQFMTHKLQVVDAYGNVLLALTRPAKVLKSRVIVQNGMGAEIGQIVQQNAIGKIRFSLEAGGHTWGSINAENWRAWNFNIQDHTAPRSPASPRRGRAWPRPCSPRPTTTSCRSTARSRTRSARWWCPPPSASTPPSSRTPAASAEREQKPELKARQAALVREHRLSSEASNGTERRELRLIGGAPPRPPPAQTRSAISAAARAAPSVATGR